MPAIRSAGIIFFRKTPHGRKYLVVRSSRDIPERGEFWDFPKGELNAGEKGIDAAKREAKEEAGIGHFEVLEEFKETARYFTRKHKKPALKFVALFLARVRNQKITLSWEHDRYEWLSYHKARERISLPQMKRALEAAEKFLQKIDVKISKRGV